MRFHLFPLNRPLLLVLLSTCLAAMGSDGSKSNTILVFGDSISAGYGMQAEESWPYLLAGKLESKGFDYRVVNASLSGETTGGGLIRLRKALEDHSPWLLILELGGNDGLRGYPIESIRKNLNAMLQLAESRKVDILFVGMVLPPNYGKRYTSAFESMYSDLAQQHQVDLVPVLLEGLLTPKSLMQRDGIHPRAEAQPLLVENFWPFIEKKILSEVTDEPAISNPEGN